MARHRTSPTTTTAPGRWPAGLAAGRSRTGPYTPHAERRQARAPHVLHAERCQVRADGADEQVLMATPFPTSQSQERAPSFGGRNVVEASAGPTFLRTVAPGVSRAQVSRAAGAVLGPLQRHKPGLITSPHGGDPWPTARPPRPSREHRRQGEPRDACCSFRTGNKDILGRHSLCLLPHRYNGDNTYPDPGSTQALNQVSGSKAPSPAPGTQRGSVNSSQGRCDGKAQTGRPEG